MKKFWNTIKDYVYIILAVVLIRSFVVTPALVDGASMDETLKDGELVLINKFVYIVSDINRFDVVVVNNEHDEDKIIKRVIALPNEKIEYKDDVLYINDKEVKGMTFEHTSDFVYETKDDEYFVMGDNRDISKDSRMLGNFKSKDIVGKVNLRIFPFKKFGSIK